MFHSSPAVVVFTLPLLGVTLVASCAKERNYASSDGSSNTGTASEGDASTGGAGGASVSPTTGRPGTASTTAQVSVTLGADAAVPEGGALVPDGSAELNDGAVADAGVLPPEPKCTKSSQCDDKNECNGTETCDDGKCKSGEVQDDGTICTGAGEQDSVCRDGNCLKSRCGDGIIDARLDEVCDDGNVSNGDGCNVNCDYTCSENAQCSDGNVCNGEESCDLDQHVCVAGTEAEDGIECGAGRACTDGRCLSTMCGDGEIDEGEECDDENLVEGDGCNADCQFDCEADKDCNDYDVCSGEETCDLETHTCKAGEPLVCDDEVPCTENKCDPSDGCKFPIIDEDGDGQSPIVEGSECGTDCDDDNDEVFVGAGEQCDEIDNDCDGENDQLPMVWYPDCDGDGYAMLESKSVEQCDKPAPPDDCPSGSRGTWTSRAPTSTTDSDCWDADPDIYPRADAVWSRSPIDGRTDYPFDYNCNYNEERQYTNVDVPTDSTCSPPVLQPSVELPVEIDAPLLNLVGTDPDKGNLQLICVGSSGWEASEAPACGQPGTYSYCDGCTRVIDTAYVQPCQ